ncbi:MAG: ChaN family lipoprotein [Bacteroidales bacterium]|nr:ChaN family lipoprotein [Bacteroidales bacterium]MBN2634334.1 ChaN family lipoprotein [Bacteroidales bacterium]
MKYFILLLLFVTASGAAQQKPAYRIFTVEGTESDYSVMLAEAVKADVVFFGELHDNPISHWLELELTKDIHKQRGSSLMLAAEMFEADNQLIIDEYLAGLFRENSFEGQVRKWNNYATDYKPLLNFAKDKGLKFIASNIPRQYASMVASGGLEALEKVSDEGRKFVAPLPVEYDPELPCYKDMLSMGGPMGGHASGNLPKAQAIKDATMAFFISKNLKPGNVVIHFNGSYHSDRHMGILWYLNRYSPGLKMVTVSTVLQDDTSSLGEEGMGKADFVIVVPVSMTRTYK